MHENIIHRQPSSIQSTDRCSLQFIAKREMITNLICENDEKPPEDGQEIDEELQSMHDVISVAHASLLNDELSVVNYKATHHNQANVQLGLTRK